MLDTELGPSDLVGSLVIVVGLWLILHDPTGNDRLYGLILVLIGTGILFEHVSDVQLEPRHVVGGMVAGGGVLLVLNPDVAQTVNFEPPDRNGRYGVVFVLFGGAILFGPEVYLEVIDTVFEKDGVRKYLPTRGAGGETEAHDGTVDDSGGKRAGPSDCQEEMTPEAGAAGDPEG